MRQALAIQLEGGFGPVARVLQDEGGRAELVQSNEDTLSLFCNEVLLGTEASACELTDPDGWHGPTDRASRRDAGTEETVSSKLLSC